MLVDVGVKRFFASLRCALNDKKIPNVTLNLFQGLFIVKRIKMKLMR